MRYTLDSVLFPVYETYFKIRFYSQFMRYTSDQVLFPTRGEIFPLESSWPLPIHLLQPQPTGIDNLMINIPKKKNPVNNLRIFKAKSNKTEHNPGR